ncbi:hypothetical protein E3N88_19913 [Mikania micrantha]|uniref:Tf2-1-like SH3-like domain-containing protein n=1 Tax=Mikania micrantha TaxID=192012 RepID=A0A5N6NSN6_9ASTR|nr:hypothetical protein E3N88_19913 [Mikania micrantha]
MTPQWWIARGGGNCLRWKYRWVNILRLELFMTPQWWIARGAGNGLRWKYRWVNILRLELFMTPQWWIARGADNGLRWKYRWKTKEFKPSFIGPFKIIARIGSVAYRLELPEKLNGIHDTFHVSYLRKCLTNESAYVQLEDLEIDNRLNYVERLVVILDRNVKHLRKQVPEPGKGSMEKQKGI